MLVEAAIIYPIVILTLLAVIHILIHMYQQTCIQSVADLSAERGGRYISGTIVTKDFNKQPLYYSFDQNSSQLEKIHHKTEEQIKQYALPSMVKVTLEGNIISPKIHVLSKQRYGMSFLYHSKEVKRRTESTYYIHDEAEYIRNIDLIIEMGYSAIDDIYKKAIEAKAFKEK